MYPLKIILKDLVKQKKPPLFCFTTILTDAQSLQLCGEIIAKLAIDNLRKVPIFSTFRKN